jgi:hypothetical protein
LGLDIRSGFQEQPVLGGLPAVRMPGEQKIKQQTVQQARCGIRRSLVSYFYVFVFLTEAKVGDGKCLILRKKAFGFNKFVKNNLYDLLSF